MKKIFKFMPVALAAISLASCNSDDFFGNNAEQEALASLEVTVEEPSVTRANAYPVYDESTKKTSDPIIWDDTDVLRVYDTNVQKFDLFKFNTTNSKFELKNAGDVEQFVTGDYGYALTGYGLSYAGWKQDASTGTAVALVNIPATYQSTDYSQGTYEEDGKTITTYKALLPLWGPVEKKADAASNKDFKAPLKWLTAYAVAQFKNGAGGKVTAVRARSLKWSALADNAAKKNALLNAAVGTLVSTYYNGTGAGTDYVEANEDAPLCGWFDAELKTNGQLVATDAPVEQPGIRSALTIPVGSDGAKDYKLKEYDSYVYLPIIPQTYKLLVFEYQVGGEWYFLRVLPENQVVARGNRIGKMVKTFASISNVVSANTTKAVSDEIAAQNTDKVEEAILNFNYNGTAATAVSLQTMNLDGYDELKQIILPQLKCNMVINVYNETNVSAAKLTIKDADDADNKNFKVVFNFIDGFNATTPKGIELNTTANVTLGGNYTNAGGLTYTAVNTLALGIAGAAPLTCTGITAITPICDLTIGDVAAAITVTNDDATKFAKTITINDDGGYVTLADSKATTVNINGTPAEVTTKATTVNVKADIAAGDLIIGKGTTTVNIENAIVADIVENDANKFDTNSPLTITTSGQSAIVDLADFANLTVANMTIRSSYSDKDYASKKAALAATAFKVPGDKKVKIFTAAQLANIDVAVTAGATSFTLMTDITSLEGWSKPHAGANAAAWTASAASPALTVDFNGNGKTISSIDAPLFTSLADGVDVSNLTINGATISTVAETGIGVLANTAAGTVTISKVSVAGTVAAHGYAGGFIGIASGDALTFDKDCVSSVTFTNNKTYGAAVGWDMMAGTFGKYVGQVSAGTLAIDKDATKSGAFDKTSSASGLKFGYNRTNNAGTITGYFKGNDAWVGYSPAATSLAYGGHTYVQNTAANWTAAKSLATAPLAYATDSKTVTGTIYILNDMTDAQVKSAIRTAFTIAGAVKDNQITWNQTVVFHNHYVATEAEVQ